MIQPGLERIGALLKNVHFSWKAVHVAGTNGKGTICAYTSNLLTRRLIKNGRFTSPHIVDRWDCININNKPVSETDFLRVENHYRQLSERENINASEFELLTATAFTLFNEEKVDVGIIEVGMGGKLDATNVLNNQVVSVISKISRDHQDFLGTTLEEIASHKAGILRPNVPFIVNPANEINVHEVIERYAQELGAGPRILVDTEDLREKVFKTKYWKTFTGPLLGFQRDNVILAFLAYVQVLRSLGLKTHLTKAAHMLDKMRNKATLPGRQQTVKVPIVFGRGDNAILVDGAHNPDAARGLRAYANQHLRRPKGFRPGMQESKPKSRITWVVAITEGKNAREVLSELLRPGDCVVTTSFGPVDGMPWVRSMDSRSLLALVQREFPEVTALAVPKRGAYRALCAAKYLDKTAHIILTGSLYLVGDFFREHAVGQQCNENGEAFPSIREIDLDEKVRVEDFSDKAARKKRKNVLDSKRTSQERVPGTDTGKDSHFREFEDFKHDHFREFEDFPPTSFAAHTDELSNTPSRHEAITLSENYGERAGTAANE